MASGLPVIRRAGAHDVPAITMLVNRAFEVEKFFVTGNRTNEQDITAKLASGVFFVAERRGRIVGCVYTERREEGRGYIGLLAVDPASQRGGLGRQLMRVAEQFCRQARCTEVVITVINLRTELMPFYRAQGYREQGTSPYSDTHRATRPCHFIVMVKPLAAQDALRPSRS